MAYNRKRSEATEQEAVIKWCRYQQGRYPGLELIHHIPNGGSRNQLEAVNLKRQGVKAGVPDLCLPVPMGEHHGMYIEMKFGKNKTTENQDWWIRKLCEQGYLVKVCYGADEAIGAIREYMHIKDNWN